VFAFEHNLPIYSIFDTGTTHLVLPDTYYKSFITTLMASAGVSDYKVEKQITFACGQTFPTLLFNFQANWLQMLPDDYVVKLLDGKDGPVCTLLIKPSTENFAVFGMPLFQGYYTTHYLLEGLISFTPHNQS
jgi:hypothetical protein